MSVCCSLIRFEIICNSPLAMIIIYKIFMYFQLGYGHYVLCEIRNIKVLTQTLFIVVWRDSYLIVLHLIFNFSGNVISQSFNRKKVSPLQPRGSEGITPKRMIHAIPRSSSSSNSNGSKDDPSDQAKACMSNYQCVKCEPTISYFYAMLMSLLH